MALFLSDAARRQRRHQPSRQDGGQNNNCCCSSSDSEKAALRRPSPPRRRHFQQSKGSGPSSLMPPLPISATALAALFAAMAVIFESSPLRQFALTSADGENEVVVAVGTPATTAREATTMMEMATTAASTMPTATTTSMAETPTTSSSLPLPSSSPSEEGSSDSAAAAAVPPLRNPFYTFTYIPQHPLDLLPDVENKFLGQELNDVFYRDEEGVPPSPREADALEYYWEERRTAAAGVGENERLFDYPDDFFFDDTLPSPFILMDYVRHVAGDDNADPTDFPSANSKYAAALVNAPTSSSPPPPPPSSPSPSLATQPPGEATSSTPSPSLRQASSSTHASSSSTEAASSSTSSPPSSYAIEKIDDKSNSNNNENNNNNNENSSNNNNSNNENSNNNNNNNNNENSKNNNENSNNNNENSNNNNENSNNNNENSKLIRIAGSAFMLSEKTVQQHFCPEARRVAWAVAKGLKRTFNMPSIFLRGREGLYYSKEKGDYGEIVHEYVSDYDSGYHDKAPIVAVMEVPTGCFKSFMWRKRFHKLEARPLDVVVIDEEGGRFKQTGEKVTAVLPVEAAPFEVAFYIGYYRFYKFVEELALNRHTQLRDALDRYAKRFIKFRCEEDEGNQNFFKKERRLTPLTLRYCFFNMKRGELLENGLGVGIVKKERYDWNGNGEKQQQQHWLDWLQLKANPNPTYIKAVLCGAKEESWLIVKHVLDNSFVDTIFYHSVGKALKDGKLSLDAIPSDVASLPGPYSKAGECTTESLMQQQYIDGFQKTKTTNTKQSTETEEEEKKKKKGIGARIVEVLRGIDKKAKLFMAGRFTRLFRKGFANDFEEQLHSATEKLKNRVVEEDGE